MQAPLTLIISFIKLINSPFWHKPVASTVLETENFQIFKPDLDKAEEPEIKLPTSIEKARELQEKKKSTSASLTMLKPLMMWITTNWKILKEMGTCLLRNL